MYVRMNAGPWLMYKRFSLMSAHYLVIKSDALSDVCWTPVLLRQEMGSGEGMGCG